MSDSTDIAPGRRKWSETTYAIRRRAAMRRHSSRVWTTTHQSPRRVKLMALTVV
jgi:hypothetical protein